MVYTVRIREYHWRQVGISSRRAIHLWKISPPENYSTLFIVGPCGITFKVVMQGMKGVDEILPDAGLVRVVNALVLNHQASTEVELEEITWGRRNGLDGRHVSMVERSLVGISWGQSEWGGMFTMSTSRHATCKLVSCDGFWGGFPSSPGTLYDRQHLKLRAGFGREVLQCRCARPLPINSHWARPITKQDWHPARRGRWLSKLYGGEDFTTTHANGPGCCFISLDASCFLLLGIMRISFM